MYWYQDCVWRFDRFARSVSHLLRALETFKALGIDFVSFSEQWTLRRLLARWSLLCWVLWPSWNAV
jgi:hypothetical protein